MSSFDKAFNGQEVSCLRQPCFTLKIEEIQLSSRATTIYENILIERSFYLRHPFLRHQLLRSPRWLRSIPPRPLGDLQKCLATRRNCKILPATQRKGPGTALTMLPPNPKCVRKRFNVRPRTNLSDTKVRTLCIGQESTNCSAMARLSIENKPPRA